MWWLDPGKEVLNILFNRVLAPYVENLDMGQVNYGIGQGQLTLHKLRLKKGALDKFRLPVDVIEGHLGKFTLHLHWLNLGNQPVEIIIEDVYLLVTPSSENTYDLEEEERRAQAAKAERLENAELLHMQGQAEQNQGDSPQQQGLIASLIAKVINNLQVTVKNIHIRYEDKLSVPGHPFSAGITLAGFSAASVDGQWRPAFIESTAKVIHKLAKLESLAVYFDTDARSLAGLSHEEFVEKFKELISQEKHISEHQFILKPVTGEGRVKINNKQDKDTPRFDIQLLFDEIGVLLDDNQYRDAISLIDMYHFYVRQHQYHRYRPSQEEVEDNKPKALWKFATTAISEEVRDRRRRWTWAYFAERRDDRQRYVELFKKKQLAPLIPTDVTVIEALEKKLSYEDIRFYRSIARSQLKKDLAARKSAEEKKKQQQQQQAQSRGSWSGWLWGSSATASTAAEEPAFTGEMTDEQRKQLYEVLDYDEKAALAASFETPRDALKARVNAKLDRGSFALKADPRGKNIEILSIVFDRFQATFLQRPDSFETSLALNSFAVHDGTTTNTLYPLIVHVQNDQKDGSKTAVTLPVDAEQTMVEASDLTDPFFFLKFESNPLDERADNALTVKLRNMEIVYHRGYVEAIYKFFQPPEGQLESVEALLDVAGQTLEDLRKETRAGLEYALQTHKTIDVQMDLNAPVIIIPEDITCADCGYLVVDAGHIAIESDLVNKKDVQEINSKKKQQYTTEDYKRLESMMYDKLSVRLESAQFVVGDDLEACRKALDSDNQDSLHLLEPINIDLQVQNSIVPTVYSLPRFKVSGHLPNLRVNLSDRKYKSLMRLIDVAIPNFDAGPDVEPIRSPTLGNPKSPFVMSSGFFSATQEYVIEDHEEVKNPIPPTPESGDDEFFEAESGDGSEAEGPEIYQHIVEVDFRVDRLQAFLFKANADNDEKELGNISFQNFALAFSMAKYTMTVDINLRSLGMNVIQYGKAPVDFISTAGTPTSEDLLTIKYIRAQPESPQFATTYEGINQSVDVKISTILVRASPEPVISLYDFIMTTFVPEPTQEASRVPSAESTPGGAPVDVSIPAQSKSDEKIRVHVKLASIQTALFNEDMRVATLSMSTADVAVLIRATTLRVNARLGNLSLSDDSSLETQLPEFKQILSIEGDNFADFQYITYDPEDKLTYKGFSSSVYLTTGSLHVHYLEESLHQIYIFLIKLAKLKGLYDVATEAAVQTVSEIERMQFEVSIKAPLIVFPCNSEYSRDVLALRLGEFSASNTYDGPNSVAKASLRGIGLSSTIYHGEEPSVLKMIDDIDATANVVQSSNIDRSTNVDQPDTQVSVHISDVKLHVTQVQYCLLLSLLQSIPRVLEGPPEVPVQVESSAQEYQLRKVEQPVKAPESQALIDLQPEIRSSSPSRNQAWTTLDLVVTLDTVKLHLYDRQVSSEEDLKECGIAKFSLNSCTLRAKMLSSGATEAEVVLKSFTLNNTRPGSSKFREIIPAAQHDRNQVMVLYTVSNDPGHTAMTVVTVDSPQILLAFEPLMALVEFFNSAPTTSSTALSAGEVQANKEEVSTSPPSSAMNLRVDLHDLSVSILENDADPDSRAIQLSIKRVFMSQQGILALRVDQIGMSLTRMGKNPETVRFLDDVDLTFSLDSRSSASQLTTSIEFTSQPITFRASYRDINLIMTIVNKAIELYGKSVQTVGTVKDEESSSLATGPKARDLAPTGRAVLNSAATRPQSVGNAKVVMSKEQFRGSCEGFRLILIGDLHEQPLLHLKLKPFILGVRDWSGELHATTTVSVHLSYWNLTNSHWEPLIDPWAFTASVTRDPTRGLMANLSARERLNLNISTTFIEMAIAVANIFGKDVEHVLRKDRGSYAPYRIRNLTGSSVFVWSDADSNASAQGISMTEISSEKSIDWRFDDWKTLREHVSSTARNSIGLQFVGKRWEQLRSIPVDREGEYTFSLRPVTEKYAYRVLCEVSLEDNVKVVTLRSTYKVENKTLYPLELMLVDETGQPMYSLEKIAPGQEYSLPIDAIGKCRVRIQPDQGFGYKWSPPIRWEDLIGRRSFTIRCPHADPNEAAFRFQAWAETDVNDLNARRFPKISLKLRAPIELENLLPYNIEYRIYDKDTDQNWRSYLRKGGVMPVHSVELGHLVLLNVSVQDTVFKPSDFSIINTDGSADFDVESKVTLRDNKDRKLDLRLNYVRYPDSGGSFKVQIYSPYLVINKTGLPFMVRPWRSNRLGSPQDVAGDTRPETTSQPTPFMLSHPSEQGKDFSFRVGESMWSQAIGLEAPSADTCLAIPSQVNKTEEIHLGVSWTEGLGKYKLTKVITMAPRFIIRNNTDKTISFREHGAAPRGRATLEPGERCPLHFMRVGDEKLLTIAFSGLNAHWSAPINVEDIGSVHFRLRNLGDRQGPQLMSADVKLGGSTIFIVISRAEEWPFAIENDSDYSFAFYQTDLDHPNNAPSKNATTYTVYKKSKVDYTWDYPAAREKRIVLSMNGSLRAIDLMEIGDLFPFKFPHGQGSRAVSLDVRAEAHKQVIRIWNYNPELSLYKPMRRGSLSVAHQETVSSHEGFEAVQEDVPPTLTLNLDFEGFGLSLINRKMVEVVYLSLNRVKFEYTNSPVAQAVHVACGSLQLDNQLHDALYPVVLQPTPIPKDASATASLPTVQASAIWLKDQEHGVTFVKYCSVLLQALTVQADEDFLFSLYDLTKFKGASWDKEQADVLIAEPGEIVEPASTTNGEDLYFEVLELQPIQLSISFMRTERVSSEEKLSIRNPFAVVLNAVTMALGNVNAAPLEMNALAIKDMRLKLPELQERVMYHYRQEVLRQLYRILGSADFIGNPVGLFTNVSSGVADIFYEPFNGVVMHGNQELGIGIAKGAASFVKKTVFGLSDSFTKFTSSVGKGLSAATFDSEYQMKRRMTQRRNRPRHAIYGVAAGAEAFATSVVSGVEGVLMKPIEGAENEGAKGFFKGIGKGLVGAVTKPVIGVFDLASNLSEGVRNTTTVFDNPARDRVRLPRHVPPDGILVPFFEREALGQYWMRDLDNGAYRRESYVAHLNLPGGDNVVLLTTARVISFWSNKLRLEWQIPFSQIQGVTIEDTGIKFSHKGGKEHDRFAYISDKSSQTWFFGKIGSVVKAFNTQRRMDS